MIGTCKKKLLMRNLIPRELISPFPEVSFIPKGILSLKSKWIQIIDHIDFNDIQWSGGDNEDDFDAIERENFRSKVLEACKSLPVLTELPCEQESVLEAVAKKLQDVIYSYLMPLTSYRSRIVQEAFYALGAGHKSVTPLKMRKSDVKFV